MTATPERWAIAFNWNRLWQPWTDGERVNWHHDARMRTFVFHVKQERFWPLPSPSPSPSRATFEKNLAGISASSLTRVSLWMSVSRGGQVELHGFPKICSPSCFLLLAAVTGCVYGKTACSQNHETDKSAAWFPARLHHGGTTRLTLLWRLFQHTFFSWREFLQLILMFYYWLLVL